MMSKNRLTALGGSDLSRQVPTLWGKVNPSRTLYGHQSEKGRQSSLELLQSSCGSWSLLTLGSPQLVPHSSSCSQSNANSTGTFSTFTHALVVPQSVPLEISPSRSHSLPSPVLTNLILANMPHCWDIKDQSHLNRSFSLTSSSKFLPYAQLWPDPGL